jgi:protein-disulfide isomerase
VAQRVKADFRAGVRAGVATTPTVFIAGAAFSGRATMDAVSRIEPGSGPARTH